MRLRIVWALEDVDVGVRPQCAQWATALLCKRLHKAERPARSYRKHGNEADIVVSLRMMHLYATRNPWQKRQVL